MCGARLQVWGWLGTDSATANAIYARFLPKNNYSVSDEGAERSFAPLSAGGVMELHDGGGSRKVSDVFFVCRAECVGW